MEKDSLRRLIEDPFYVGRLNLEKKNPLSEDKTSLDFVSLNLK
jgi:hypothetical protein